MDTFSRKVEQQPNLATCAECGTRSGLRWAGWRAHRTDDPELDEPPALALFCPACAESEFDREAD